ncbi:hypothetical protein J6590_080414 [Homalodisca vitripennis]|nr:hypothetical protein J6590_080414 [Homalodisca vitripennis]
MLADSSSNATSWVNPELMGEFGYCGANPAGLTRAQLVAQLQLQCILRRILTCNCAHLTTTCAVPWNEANQYNPRYRDISASVVILGTVICLDSSLGATDEMRLHSAPRILSNSDQLLISWNA